VARKKRLGKRETVMGKKKGGRKETFSRLRNAMEVCRDTGDAEKKKKDDAVGRLGGEESKTSLELRDDVCSEAAPKNCRDLRTAKSSEMKKKGSREELERE